MKENNKGFSLVELIVVIAVMAVLVGIIAPQFLGYVEETKEARLEYNTRGVMGVVNLYSVDYSKDKWYGSWNDNGEATLNNRIEKELEIVDSGTYINDSDLVNPYSNRMSILEYNDVITNTSSDGYRPAVFITNNSQYSYTGNGGTDCLIGTIVVYFDCETVGEETDHIEFYYVKKDGSKSDFYEEL